MIPDDFIEFYALSLKQLVAHAEFMFDENTSFETKLATPDAIEKC